MIRTIGHALKEYVTKSMLRSDRLKNYFYQNKFSESDGDPCTNQLLYRNNFCYSGAVLWNNLPTDVRKAKSLTGFRKLLTVSSNTAFMENRL